MTERVTPAHLDPCGHYGRSKDRWCNQEKAGADSIMARSSTIIHSEAAYIEADHFFYQKILLAIRRRTIHSDPLKTARCSGNFSRLAGCRDLHVLKDPSSRLPADTAQRV